MLSLLKIPVNSQKNATCSTQLHASMLSLFLIVEIEGHEMPQYSSW